MPIKTEPKEKPPVHRAHHVDLAGLQHGDARFGRCDLDQLDRYSGRWKKPPSFREPPPPLTLEPESRIAPSATAISAGTIDPFQTQTRARMTSISPFRDPTAPGNSLIPMQDWDRAPWNRWTFQHVRDLLPTTQVWRGSGPASLLPSDLRDIDAIPFVAEGQAYTVGSFLETSYADGFLVLHGGKIVAERYLNGMTRHTQHLSQSVAKSVVGTVAGILIGRGVVDPAASLTHYLPELEATAYRGASVQHVLDMTSGVVFDDTYTALDSHMAQLDVASGWKNRWNPSWHTNIWDLILSLKDLECPHGTSFRYRSIETDVLSFVLQRAAATPLAELVSRELWTPMGAEEGLFHRGRCRLCSR